MGRVVKKCGNTGFVVFQHLISMFQIEVYYLNTKGCYTSSKRVDYDTAQEASKVFDGTVSKFRKEGKKALICWREKEDENWRILRTEKT